MQRIPASLLKISISTESTEVAYFHKKKALASLRYRSTIHFTGGAILQKERENKELSTRT